MRTTILLRTLACLALVSVISACSASGVQPTPPSGHSSVVRHLDDPQTPNK